MNLDLVDLGRDLWRPANDTVMGGRSVSSLRFNESETLVFEGTVSLENGGGFASVKFRIDPIDLAKYESLRVRVRGDSNIYQVRLRTGTDSDGVAYAAPFRTESEEWETCAIPLSDFEARFRGRRVPDAPPLGAATIRQIGFLIGDRQEGPFRLEIDSVGLLRPTQGKTV